MEYRNLGNSELNVSVFSLGCLNFGLFCDQETTTKIINTAIDLGVNCIDTAALYGGPKGHCETIVGKAIEGQREKVILATKFGADPATRGSGIKDGGTRDYIVKSVEESLTRLDTDYIDLYQMHFPDHETPIDETLRALDDLVSSGKVRYIGSSNFASWQISEAAWTAITNELNHFISLQTRYSILNRDMEKEIVPACEKHNISILPFFPLEKDQRLSTTRPGLKLPLQPPLRI